MEHLMNTSATPSLSATPSPTGRMTNRGPNLQQIPIGSPEAARIRAAFLSDFVLTESGTDRTSEGPSFITEIIRG